jgi:hypothetical protein
MKRPILPLVLLFFLVLVIADCARKKQGLNEDTFIGEWYTVKGDVEAYSFMKDDNGYIFTGTLHKRPVVYGTWKIDKDKFVITMDDGIVKSYVFSVTNDTLILNNGEEIYTKTVPFEVQFPEVRILKEMASDFSSHKFSEPRQVEFIWEQWIDSTQSSKDLQLKGFSVTMTSSLGAYDIENLSGYLTDHGFTKDTIYVTEICNGFWDGDQVVTLCTGQDPNATNDSVSIIISSAFIKKLTELY